MVPVVRTNWRRVVTGVSEPAARELRLIDIGR
jgi:hypothetical protein